MIVEAKEALEFDTVDDVVNDIRAGRIVIVTDDADRENEGDLVMAAEKPTNPRCPATKIFSDFSIDAKRLAFPFSPFAQWRLLSARI